MKIMPSVNRAVEALNEKNKNRHGLTEAQQKNLIKDIFRELKDMLFDGYVIHATNKIGSICLGLSKNYYNTRCKCIDWKRTREVHKIVYMPRSDIYYTFWTPGEESKALLYYFHQGINLKKEIQKRKREGYKIIASAKQYKGKLNMNWHER